METQQVCLKVGGLKLLGELYIPQKDKPCPTLCICHGIPDAPYNPADRGYATLAQRFCAAGFITLIFNFRGTGKSEGNLDILGWSQDLEAAVDFLFGLEEVDRTHLGLLGFSGGAAVSIYTAAHNPKVSSLVACACPADFTLLVREESAMSSIQHFRDIGAIRDGDFPKSVEQWVNGFETLSPIRCIDKISPRPLLLIHGDADEVVPLEHAHKLYQKAKEPKEIAIIPDGKHKLRLEAAAMATALNWLKLTNKLT